MLVLQRKAGESFTVDGHIKITVLGKYGSVRIGIDAPKNIPIRRDNQTHKQENASINTKSFCY